MKLKKAHPDVFNLMLQILEDGRLTDSKGRVIDFKNVLLILTSNIGSKVIEKGGGGLGFELSEDESNSQYNRIKSLVNDELKQYFRPEFLNRLDEIIVFRQLTKDEVGQIAEIMLKEVFDRLSLKGIQLAKVEYSLTEFGLSVMPILRSFSEWNKRNTRTISVKLNKNFEENRIR